MKKDKCLDFYSVVSTSVADLGSGAILTPGSGWLKNQDPGSRSRMNNPNHISESLGTIFWVKILKFFDADAEADPGSGNLFDPGSEMVKIRIRDKHPGSARVNM